MRAFQVLLSSASTQQLVPGDQNDKPTPEAFAMTLLAHASISFEELTCRLTVLQHRRYTLLRHRSETHLSVVEHEPDSSGGAAAVLADVYVR